MRYESQIGRYFTEYKGKDLDPKNSVYRLKSLKRNEESRPTTQVTESGEAWTFRQARDYTKLCVEWNVPDVNQRLTGVFANNLFVNEIPLK